jgi:hypothetical protein
MNALFANGWIISWILAGMLLEAAALTGFHAWRGRGVAPKNFLANLASGMCLLLAMRLALGGAWWGFTAASLLGALIFHVTDLARNWS